MVIVCSSPTHGPEECQDLSRGVDRGIPVLFDRNQLIANEYRVRRTPSATLIVNGIARLHGIPNNRDQVEALINEEVTISRPDWQVLLEEQREEGPMHVASHV